mmetsp:Transcript_22805/g.55382  ORF Transcript_22805/g.55382 Transcript_22805/m.55382 type:complete len:269 (-) Transcript_22805:506-1312(-)
MSNEFVFRTGTFSIENDAFRSQGGSLSLAWPPVYAHLMSQPSWFTSPPPLDATASFRTTPSAPKSRSLSKHGCDSGMSFPHGGSARPMRCLAYCSCSGRCMRVSERETLREVVQRLSSVGILGFGSGDPIVELPPFLPALVLVVASDALFLGAMTFSITDSATFSARSPTICFSDDGSHADADDANEDEDDEVDEEEEEEEEEEELDEEEEGIEEAAAAAAFVAAEAAEDVPLDPPEPARDGSLGLNANSVTPGFWNFDATRSGPCFK